MLTSDIRMPTTQNLRPSRWRDFGGQLWLAEMVKHTEINDSHTQAHPQVHTNKTLGGGNSHQRNRKLKKGRILGRQKKRESHVGKLEADRGVVENFFELVALQGARQPGLRHKRGGNPDADANGPQRLCSPYVSKKGRVNTTYCVLLQRMLCKNE